MSPIHESMLPWALLILGSLKNLGGSAKRKEVHAKIRQAIGDRLTAGQWGNTQRTNRIDWARFGLKSRGYLEGERGVWRITQDGMTFLADREGASLLEPKSIPDDNVAKTEPDQKSTTETVAATDRRAFEIPILRTVRESPLDRKEVLEQLRQSLKDVLLPGDMGNLPGNIPVWEDGVSWTIADLIRQGMLKDSGQNVVEVSDRGEELLEKDSPSWSIERFQNASAIVSSKKLRDGKATRKIRDDGFDEAAWRAIQEELGSEGAAALESRLAPQIPASHREGLGRNVILYGPPGTGKTFLAKRIAHAFTSPVSGEPTRWKIVQFHPSYAYEDFIQGLRPELEQRALRYKIAQGPFLQLCAEANNDPARFFVLIIDEINRGDPARIFGELLYGLEYRNESVDLALGGKLVVPENLVVVGTMNSVDRSVALVDHALRRRFAFVRLSPDPDVIPRIRRTESAAIYAQYFMRELNTWLREKIDREHQIGQSYFLKPGTRLDSIDVLDKIWRADLAPLMEEYLFGDAEGIRDVGELWRRLCEEARAEVEEET